MTILVATDRAAIARREAFLYGGDDRPYCAGCGELMMNGTCPACDEAATEDASREDWPEYRSRARKAQREAEQ